MATEIIKIIPHTEDGYEVHVAKGELGFGVTIYDTDAEMFLGIVKFFPTVERALAYADTL